jgi:hypothetical protein
MRLRVNALWAAVITAALIVLIGGTVAGRMRPAADPLGAGLNCVKVDKANGGFTLDCDPASAPAPSPSSTTPPATTPPPTTPPPTTPPATTPPPTTPPPTTPPPPTTGCRANPGACGFPDAASTGAHGNLVALTGNMTVSTAGAVVHDVAIAGCVTVTAPNVTFRNVRITCGSGGYIVDNGTVRSAGSAYNTGIMTLDHVTLICSGHGGTAVGEARVHAVAVDISRCENGFDIDTVVTVADSYIHDLLLDPVAHTDGIQVWPGASDITFQHNTVLVVDDNAAFTTGGNNARVAITGNLLDGGSFTVYCAGDAGQLTGNRWGPIFPGTGFPAGYTDRCANMTRTGNVSDVTGLPIPNSQLP